LESRRLLAAEGETFALVRNLESLSLAGEYTASVDWGDGTSSTAQVETGQAPNKITAKINYSLDTSGFFTTARRQLLQSVVDSIVGRFSDTLTAIQPSGSNTWQAIFDHPSLPNGNTQSRSNLTIAQNEILIFAGARPMDAPQLGQGGPGGFSGSGSQVFLNTLQSRGQGTTTGGNANDFGPWGGSISFNTRVNWYFGNDADQLQADQHDFVTVAAHEMFHLLGFGVSAAWQRLVSGGVFTGSNSRAQFDGSGNPPLSSDRGHWQFDLADNGMETLLDPDQTTGIRKIPTPLDIAGLKDIGWSIPGTVSRVTAGHVYPDNGQYLIRVTLVGSLLGRVQQEFTVEITNVAPSLTVVSGQTVVAGQPLVITNVGSISDPGFRNTAVSPATAETFTYSIDWGDAAASATGSATIDQIGNSSRPTLASFDANHTYVTPGNYTVRVTVRDDDDGVTSRTFPVVVLAPPVITLSTNRGSVVEDGSIGATLTVRRTGGDTSAPLKVNLQSSDTSELSVQGEVTFAANETQKNVTLVPVDDNLLDGPQNVTITASAVGIIPATVEMIVQDAEFLTVNVLDPTVREDAGDNAVRIRLTRSNSDTSDALTVTVSGSNPMLLEPITAAIIPAGQSSVVIRLDAVDDLIAELTKQVTLNFAAAGYSGSQGTITILDNEPPRYQNPGNALDVDGDGNVKPVDSLKIINFLNREPGSASLDPELGRDLPFYDVSGDYLIQPLDALRIINALNRGNTGEPEGFAPISFNAFQSADHDAATDAALRDFEYSGGELPGPLTAEQWRKRYGLTGTNRSSGT
jgi:hypothetical protein